MFIAWCCSCQLERPRGIFAFLVILLSNDLGQRDASDIPIWLPPGLSHVP